MDPQTQHTIETALEAINQLAEACRKNGPLYHQHPREATQVNRNAKWLLNALANLNRSLNSDEPAPDQQS